MSFMFRTAVAGLTLGAAVAFGGVGVAAADEPAPPNCTAADLAGVMSGVNAATSAYLFTHPDVNNFFTGLKGQPKDQMRTAVQNYMDANPQVGNDLRGIRQPAADFHNRCGGSGQIGGPMN